MAASSLQHTVNLLAEQTGMRQWTINRWSDENYVVLAANDVDGGLAAGDRIPWSHTICALMVDGRGPRIAESLPGTVYEHARTPLLQAYMGHPLIDETGRVVGTLAGTDTTARTDLAQFTASVDLLAQHVSQLLGAASLRADYALSLQLAAHDSGTDPLTRIGNRRAWDCAMRAEQHRISAYGTQAGIIVVDVDHLKRINDTRGHRAGDQALCAVAQAICSTIRIPHLAARLGGDEFAVLIGDISAANLDLVVADLRAELDERGTGASIGSAVAADGDLTTTFHRADDAMYASKTSRCPGQEQ